MNGDASFQAVERSPSIHERKERPCPEPESCASSWSSTTTTSPAHLSRDVFDLNVRLDSKDGEAGRARWKRAA